MGPDDDKIWSSYSSSSVNVESLMFCVFVYVWVLFVYFQVSVFDGCSSMENALVLVMGWIPCYIVDVLYEECESHFFVMVGAVVFGGWMHGVEERL
jgi:hypothetical protein